MCSLFILPLGVAGDGARYFLISLFFIHGNPVSWLFAIAFSNVAIGGLQKPDACTLLVAADRAVFLLCE